MPIKTSFKLAVMASAVGGIALVLPPVATAGAGTSAQALASSVTWAASIIPASYIAMGNALPYGNEGSKYGVSLTANDIANFYAACSPRCNYYFAVYLFTNSAVTTKLVFEIVSPKKQTVYQYNFGTVKAPEGTDSFYVDASGNFGDVGTYYAEVYGGSKLIGWIPMPFGPK